jgi:hypothetical protein
MEGARHPRLFARLAPPRNSAILVAMRTALPIALAASLTLGAAPPPGSGMAECRLPHGEAMAAIRRLPVRDRDDYASEDGYTHTKRFGPARIAAFGFPARSFDTVEVDAIGHDGLTLTTTFNAPYAAIHAAALASRGKRECANNDGPPGYCEIDERELDGWVIAFLLENRDGYPTLTCLYTRPTA